MNNGPASAPRRVVSITLVVLGVVALVGGAVMTWVDTHVFDTDTVVETTHSMMEQPEIRQLVRTELSQRIEGVVDPLVAPFVAPAVDAVTDDARFTTVLDDAVRSAHSILVDGDAEAIVFSLEQVQPIIKEKLDAVDPSIYPQIPNLGPSLQYTLTERSELPRVWDAVERFHRAAFALVALGVLLVALALVIGPSRWALLLLVGGATLISSLVARFAISRINATIEGRIDEPSTEAGAVAVAELFTAPLADRLTVLLVVGGGLVVAGIIVRLVRPRTRIEPGRADAFLRH